MTEHIGIYRVERPIGHGGMGEVFLAWDDRLERRVAIKRIRRDGLSSEQRDRLRREARLAARLSHSAIVQIHDLVTEGDDDAIVMEYVEGQTLTERLSSGPLEIGEALRLAVEIANGLAAAHRAGLIHRDLKAANVVVTPEGQAKILDFGLARPTGSQPAADAITREGMIAGTFHVMSPEQARGEELDERSDLFSFGALLYEMLTGHSPFRDPDPFESLRRVMQEPAPDPLSLRPGIPAGILALLDRLLAKDRRDRPDSAREVITALERSTASAAGATVLSETLSDQPTAAAPRWRESFPAVHPQQPPPSTIVGHSIRGRRRVVLAGVALALCVALSVTLWSKRPAAPLRVAIARPEIPPEAAGDKQLALAASAVLTATLSSLASLQGVTAIDPRETGRGGTLPVAMARTAAADETLTSSLEREGALVRVSLRRVRGRDGAVLWTEMFKVPIDPASLRLLDDATTGHLRRAYPDHPVRPGTPELDVRDEDYAAFLEIRNRIASGQMALEPEITRLEKIVESSPRFLEAQILAARFSLSLFTSSGDPDDHDRAARLVQQARALAPDDPRPLLLELHIALAAHRVQEAEEILARIDRALPGDPEVLPLRARLAERQGRPEEALGIQRLAVEQVPSWQNLLRLAQLEAQQGQIDQARERIAEILRQAPDNFWAQEKLGELELSYGDLAKAEQIYLKLTGVEPWRAYSNIGMARSLGGRYREAADAYRRALAVDPDNTNGLLNLAETEVELGHPQEAETLYRRVLALYAKSPEDARRGPRDALIEAQCLARLGQTRQAVQIAQEALRRLPDDPIYLWQSALVHSLAGDRSSALNNAQAALEKGLRPHWFSGSAFRALREDPELRPWLERRQPEPPLRRQD